MCKSVSLQIRLLVDGCIGYNSLHVGIGYNSLHVGIHHPDDTEIINAMPAGQI